MRYDPLRHFAAPAAARAEIWRTGAGVVLTVVAGLALYQFAIALLAGLLGPQGFQDFVDRTTFGHGSPAATLYMLFSFGFFGIGLAMVVHSLHRRSLRSLLGAPGRLLPDFLRVASIVGGLYLLLAIVLPPPVELLRNDVLTARAWIAVLPVALAAIMVQATTEELLFRGYLQQQLAARLPGLPIWLVGPSLLFGLAHMDFGTAGANAPLFFVWAVAFGLAAADLTARTGSIGAALGLHAANNALALLFVSIGGAGSGLALYHLPLLPNDPRIPAMMLSELGVLLCGWLTARLVLRV